MVKEIHLKIGGEDCLAELPDRGKSIYIVGADTYYGAHLALHWRQHGYTVSGCGATAALRPEIFTRYEVTDYSALPLPEAKFAWIFYCHDAHDGFAEHLRGVQTLGDTLLKRQREYKIAYLSSGAIYESSAKPLRENARIQPHNQYELAAATAENCLQECCFQSGGKILPYILRCGDIYGSEFGQSSAYGLIGRYLTAARAGQPLLIPGLGNTSRSLLHVADACEAAIKILTMDFPPQCVNLPGEKRMIIELALAIADKYHIEADMGANSTELREMLDDEFSPYAGHRSLSSAFFRKCVDFVPVHKFDTWLKSIPA